MIKEKTIPFRVGSLLLLCLLLIEFLFVALPLNTCAATKRYSSVTTDLEQDPEFDALEYPPISGDTSIRVIQIAEGEGGELFLYVYQPGNAERDLKASYVNMSLQNRTEANPVYNLYSLTFLNSEGVFSKYLVNDVNVSDVQYRYYNIATVYRPFDAEIDAPAAESDDVKGYIGFSVGRCYCLYYNNDTLIYECEKVDVVDIEILAVGTIRYSEGFKFYLDKCDSHFVAFSVENYDVDKIIDATVVYTTQTYDYTYVPLKGETETYGDPIVIKKDISSLETASNDGDGLFGVKYAWQRILTKDAFRAQLEDFANEEIVFQEGGLEQAQFVFQFLETDYYSYTGVTDGVSTKSSVKVTNVGILRLHFLVDGRAYNLGVVSDLVSDDGEPDFEITIGDNFENQGWWEKMMMLLALIALLILGSYFPPLFSFVFKVLSFVLELVVKIVFGLLSLPFKVIKVLKK